MDSALKHVRDGQIGIDLMRNLSMVFKMVSVNFYLSLFSFEFPTLFVPRCSAAFQLTATSDAALTQANNNKKSPRLFYFSFKFFLFEFSIHFVTLTSLARAFTLTLFHSLFSRLDGRYFCFGFARFIFCYFEIIPKE